MSDNALYDAFFALHHGLPRQGPGSDATTRRLLSLATLAGPLPERPRVLDLGCGPGRSALLLAGDTGAEVTAVDLHEPFLAELRRAADARGLGDAVRTVAADMGGLPFPDGSFDLVWAESSAYAIGFDRALRSWRRLLAPHAPGSGGAFAGGTLVLTECEWTTDSPSREARAFWDRHYALRTTAANTAAAVAAGYHVIGTHRQPESDWDEYYGPLGARADAADPAAPGMAEALAATRAEIAVRREHGSEYGYTGYVLRPADPRWRTRPETGADLPAVRALTTAAFGREAEARLVDALREDASAWLPELSYVAEAPDGTVAAYALITRCRVGDEPAAALAPVAVAPGYQRQGAGQAVVRAVLDAARLAGERLVLVLGHPEYYPRFGFTPASRFGIRPSFDVPDDAMMALDLDGSGKVPLGTIHYPRAFGV
ncbi:bifunctional class I SAM-dependent methyltransferase/N-acetyltransferase [Streptomyces sp. CA-252508]|uniref:bifunctional class I SAM-dependent methyltransferase/N-acetyltransferase n=1 Tax=Streptomyces sp. CA-252508 TaxID=3418946 RepID=UPI003D8D4FB3